MPRRLTGIVVSDKMDKTVAVSVSILKEHPLYRKKYHLNRKFLAHDPNNECKVGQTVQIIETSPRSRRKRWLVEETLAQGEGGGKES